MLKFTVLGLLITNNAWAFDPCKDTVAHKPRADVNYNPKGDSLNVTPESSTKFPITIDLAERYGIDIPAGLELDAQFGDIEIDANNHIFYNGEDITSDIKDTCDNEPSEFEAVIEQETKNGDKPDTGGKLP